MNYGEILSKATGRELVIYKTFGDYQGDWLCILKDEAKHYIYKGCYGSCSGCDSLEAFEDYSYDKDFWTMEKVQQFFKEMDYTPFVEVPNDVFRELLAERKLATILPANTRLDFDIDYTDVEDGKVMAMIEDSIISGDWKSDKE